MTRTKKKKAPTRYRMLVREIQGDLEHIGYAVKLTFNDTETVADLTAADAEGNTVNITGITPLSVEDAHSNIGRYRQSFDNIHAHGVLEAWQRIKALPDAERQTLQQGFYDLAEKWDATNPDGSTKLRALANAIDYLGQEHHE
jgi:DUF971 family protein